MSPLYHLLETLSVTPRVYHLTFCAVDSKMSSLNSAVQHLIPRDCRRCHRHYSSQPVPVPVRTIHLFFVRMCGRSKSNGQTIIGRSNVPYGLNDRIIHQTKQPFHPYTNTQHTRGQRVSEHRFRSVHSIARRARSRAAAQQQQTTKRGSTAAGSKAHYFSRL